MEVVSGRCEHGVNRITRMMCKLVVAADAVLAFKMADNWFDGGGPQQLTFDLWCVSRRLWPDVYTLNL
jgi:hypothetical protein